MKAIVFGASGQDGIYLSMLLQENMINVVPVNRGEPGTGIQSFEDVSALVKQHQPEYIFHFAADSTTRHEVWRSNHETISTGTLNILESVKIYSPQTKVFLSGSGLQFENNGFPIKESDPFLAGSPYAVSRIHSTYAARYYRSLGIKAYVGYFFNHDSPYRSERHINKKIAETARRISAGSKERLEIGDLEVQKEFGFAGDIVKAVFTLVNQDTVFEAVVGTGKAYSIQQWIEICFDQYGLKWENYYERLPGFISDHKLLVSDPATIFSLGWKPGNDIYSLAKMMCAE